MASASHQAAAALSTSRTTVATTVASEPADEGDGSSDDDDDSSGDGDGNDGDGGGSDDDSSDSDSESSSSSDDDSSSDDSASKHGKPGGKEGVPAGVVLPVAGGAQKGEGSDGESSPVGSDSNDSDESSGDDSDSSSDDSSDDSDDSDDGSGHGGSSEKESSAHGKADAHTAGRDEGIEASRRAALTGGAALSAAGAAALAAWEADDVCGGDEDDYWMPNERRNPHGGDADASEQAWPCPFFAPRHRQTPSQPALGCVEDATRSSLSDSEAIPQPGDSIAFRQVELDASWTPAVGGWQYAEVLATAPLDSAGSDCRLTLCMRPTTGTAAASPGVAEADEEIVEKRRSELLYLRCVHSAATSGAPAAVGAAKSDDAEDAAAGVPGVAAGAVAPAAAPPSHSQEAFGGLPPVRAATAPAVVESAACQANAAAAGEDGAVPAVPTPAVTRAATTPAAYGREDTSPDGVVPEDLTALRRALMRSLEEGRSSDSSNGHTSVPAHPILTLTTRSRDQRPKEHDHKDGVGHGPWTTPRHDPGRLPPKAGGGAYDVSASARAQVRPCARALGCPLGARGNKSYYPLLGASPKRGLRGRAGCPMRELARYPPPFEWARLRPLLRHLDPLSPSSHLSSVTSTHSLPPPTSPPSPRPTLSLLASLLRHLDPLSPSSHLPPTNGRDPSPPR